MMCELAGNAHASRLGGCREAAPAAARLPHRSSSLLSHALLCSTALIGLLAALPAATPALAQDYGATGGTGGFNVPTPGTLLPGGKGGDAATSGSAATGGATGSTDGGYTGGAGGAAGTSGSPAGGDGTGETGGGGGGGGAGYSNTNASTAIIGNLTGGKGGDGGGTTVGGSGGGGAGGDGLVSTATNNLSIASGVTIQGGDGGAGGTTYGTGFEIGDGGTGSGGAAGGPAKGSDSGSGGGGGGGAGIAVVTSGITLTNNGTVNGGTGGSSITSDGIIGGGGGGGGAGVIATGVTIINNGEISGGDGGVSGNAKNSINDGGAGDGGSGIVGGNLTIINSGTISAGTANANHGGADGNAITFTGGINTLELRAGTVINGNVVGATGAGTSNTLILSGTANETLNMSADKFQNFTAYEKTGTGTWTLTGTTNGTTPWTLLGGVLSIGNDGALGGGGLTFDGGTLNATQSFDMTRAVALNAGGGTFDVDSGATLTMNGAVMGTGGLVKTDTGTLTLSGVNDYTGATTINGGTLALSGSSSIAASSGVSVAGGATFDIQNTTSGASIKSLSGAGSVALGGQTLTLTQANSTFSGAISGAGALTLTAGTQTLSGNVNIGGTLVNGGTLGLSGGGPFAFSGVSVAYGATFDISQAANGARTANLSGAGSVVLGNQTLTLAESNGTFSGVISGDGNLWVTGAEPTLSGKNTYTGTTTIVGAVRLKLSGDGSLGSSSVEMVNDGILDLREATSGETSIRSLSGGSGTVRLGTQKLILTQANGTFAGGMDGTNGVEVAGGTQTFAGNMNYTGGTTIGAGATLQIGNGGKYGLIKDDVVDNGTLIFNRGTAYSFAGSISGAGAVSQIGPATLTLSGANNYTGGTTIGTGTTLQVGDGATSGSIAGDVLDNGTLTFDRSDASTFAGAISGAGAVNQIGSGTLTLSGASGYTGATAIDNGSLALSGSGSISGSSGVSIASGAAFDISGTTNGTNIKSLSGAGDVTLGGQALTLTNANGTFSGALSGTGGLTLTGGMETLTGTNNSIGAVTVGGGTLAFGQNGMFGTTSYDTQSGATTTLGGAAQLAVSGAFTQDAGSTLNITVGSSNTPVITAGTASLGGTLNIAGISSESQLPQVLVSTANGIGGDFSPVSIGSFVGTVDYLTVHTGKSADDTEYLATYGLSWTANNSLAHGTFTLTNPSDSFNVGIALGDETANPVTGWDGESLTKAGDGTLILSAANVYTGGTTITGGVLQLGNGVNAGSILGNISTSDPADSTKSGTLVFEEPDATTFGGVISGSGSVKQAGPGSLTLSAANSYLGGTTVDTGATLVVGNDSALGTGALTMQEGSTLDTSGSHTLANAISLSGDPTVNVNSSLMLNLAGAISDGASPGILEKTGDGTLILSADNSYSGGTTIRGGTLQLGSGGTSGSIVGNVVDNGTLAFDRGDTYVFNGLISGSGAVNQIGTGTTVLTEDNSYGGGTTISGGTLQLGNGGASGSIVGDVVDNGTLAFDRSDTYVFSGVISGSGAVKQTGTGTTVLTGANSYDGGTTLNGGALQVSRDANLGDTAGALTFDGGILNTTGTFSTGRAATLNAGGGTFDVDPSTTLTMSGAIDGVGNLTKAGGGTLDLTADSSAFTGSTTIEAGLLSVNGSLANSDIAVDNGATLGGPGKVGAIEIGSGGTLSPGDGGIGTLAATGNVNFLSGSHYKVDIDASGQSDRLDVSGAVTIAGNSTVDVLSAPGGYALGNRYTILSANGGVSGDFAGLSFSSPLSMPFRSFGLEHDMLNDPDNIYLTVARSSVTFASVGQTPNQIGVGGALDGLSSSNPLVAALVQLDTPAAGAAFDQLSGEVHASTKSALIEDSRFVRGAIDNRIRNAFDGVAAPSMPVLNYGETGTDSRATSAIDHALAPADTANLAAWGSVFGSWGSTDGNGNAAELSRSVGGFFTGIDGLVAENVRLGIMTGYSHDSFHVDGRGWSGQSDNYHLGIYGVTQIGPLGLRAGAAYTWHEISTGRSVAFPGFADSLTADYHAGTFQAFGEAGYRVDTMTASFEPFANLAYVNLHTDGFTEKGGAAALHADNQTTDTTFTTLGIRASTAFDLGGMKATARGMVGWRHAFGDTTPLATLALAGGDAFTVAGVPISKDAAVMEAGLDFAVSDNATFGISYIGQFGSQARDNGARASLSVKF